MPRRWTGRDDTYAIDWAGLSWELAFDRGQPGLRWGSLGPLLSLEGLATPGRRDTAAFGPGSLVRAECRFDRVEATYQPAGWGDLTVLAAWSPHGEDALDLRVEISARSVGELKALEVLNRSVVGDLPPFGSMRSVEPRDARSAGLTYDGREDDLDVLSTGPPRPISDPWLAPRTGLEGWTYAELVHPDDASRRIHEGTLPFTCTRYGLFGYDLERGVVLRGRLRGAWLPKSEAYSRAEALVREFLDEPPPLST